MDFHTQLFPILPHLQIPAFSLDKGEDCAYVPSLSADVMHSLVSVISSCVHVEMELKYFIFLFEVLQLAGFSVFRVVHP